jgi:hypothetical protein
VSLVAELENKYSGTLLPLEGKIRVDLKALIPIATEKTLLQANPVMCPMQYRVILQAAASFYKQFFKGPKKLLSKGCKV